MMTTLAQIGALFTAPALAAAGVAAVSIPIAIHMLSRLRRQRVVWAAMRFLEEAWRRQRRRMQLEQWLLLLVRCLLLAILGLALAGPQSALLGALGLSQSSRLICVVLDDSLNTSATDAGQPQRFEALKAAAISIIDATTPGDRVALWTASSPVELRLTPGPVNRDAARRVIEQLKPSYAKADMPAAMMEVNQTVLDADLPQDRVVVAVVSDFALGSLNPAQPPPGVMANLAQRATLWLRRPNLALPNVQITSLTSTRGMLLASPLSPLSVPLTVGLSRFGSDAADELCLVHVQLTSSDGRQTRQLERELRWTAGQSQAVLNIEAPAADMLPAGGVMMIQARVESITKTDALSADNQRWMTLKVKQQLRVGLIDVPASIAGSAGSAQSLTQGKWLELALAPAAGQSMELATINPSNLSQATLEAHDALLVLRPDLVTETGWQSLAESASQGRLVWVFTPAGQDGANGNGGAGNSGVNAAVISTATWPAAMRSAFDLPWSLGMEAMTFDEPLALAGDARVPEPLAMLGPDWQDMQRPVRLMKMLNLNLQTAPASDAWLTAADGKTVMASRPVGQGQLIVLAVSIDPSWTDMMVKPLFVPLVHETLRGVLGDIARRRQTHQAKPGQKLTLPVTWAQVKTLSLKQGPAEAEGQTAEPWEVVTNRATPTGAGQGEGEQTSLPELATVRMTAEPVTWPGVYEGSPSTAADEKLLAVNLDPEAGDTRAGAGTSVTAWFGLDQREPWLDQTNPGSMLARTVTQADLGLPLLWAVLALLLFETILARRFSHSQATNLGPSWLGRWWQRMVS